MDLNWPTCAVQEADFGEVVNQEYLDKIIQNAARSYRAYDYSTYTEEEKQILKKFYKALSLKFHPDLNPDTDTAKEMQLLNKLKESWKL